MAKRTVTTNMLTPNKTFMVRGKLTFSRVVTQVAGDELVKDMQRRQQKRMNPIDKPYTTASICDAQVIYRPSENGMKTPEDIYAEESLYQSTSPTATGFCFSGYNKGKNLPWIGTARNDGNGGMVVDQIPYEEIKGELASGLDVTLVMRVFSATPNQGVSMDGIIVNEPVRYYSGTGATGLADYGITFNPAPGTQAPAPAAAHAASAGAPVPPPNGDPYAYSGAPAPTAPAAPAAPAGAAAPGSYAYPGANPAPAAPAAPPAPPVGYTYPGQTAPAPAAPAAPAAAPFQATPPAGAPAAAPAANTGIRYNPADRQY